ncbi:proline-rich protein 22 [Gymnogyps californianus]|uniref:proline-rich protein 22 n=1 Tax=Gymnogyps californianus TaxID=33616 RepID=UPI0021C5B4EB|nr:proline-rich protein 22 [Gymnogyps californianus]
MALPPLRLPPRGSWPPPAPQFLQTFVLPETFYPQGRDRPQPLQPGDALGGKSGGDHRRPSLPSLSGSATLFQVPGQEQPFPAAWVPQAPPAGLQRAPCGCFFDPRVFHIQWTAPYKNQGTAVAPAPPVLLTSIPSYQPIEGQSAQINISSTATPAEASLGSDVPPSPCAAPHNQALEDLADNLAVSEEMLLEEALRLFGCSLDAMGVSQDDPSSGPMPGDPGDTSGEGTAVAPALPVLLTSIPSFEPIEGQSAQINISSTATPAEAPLGSDVPPSPCAAPHNQALEDPAHNLALLKEVPLKEALTLFDCSLDAVGVSQDDPSSGPMPGHPDDTGTAIPPCDFSSLSLPKELLTPDYSIPETTDTTVSLEEFNAIGMEPQEPGGDAGMDLPPSQPAPAEKRGKKWAKSTLPKPPSKRRALAASMGVAEGD